MQTRFKDLGLRAAIALASLSPVWAWAQANPNCGLAGQPPCPVSEPGSWPLVAVALVAVGLAMRRRK